MMTENQRLADRKLELENGLLEIELEEKSNPRGKTWWDKSNNWIKRWSVTILTLVSVGGGIWGLILPIKSYVDEREKKLVYDLNSQMVDLVNDLSVESKSEAAIMMLQYYEMNAIDILIFKLERAGSEETLVEVLSGAINNIYKKQYRYHDDILNKLFYNTVSIFDKLTGNEEFSAEKLATVLNYISVLSSLETTTKDQKKISDFIETFKQKVPKKDDYMLLIHYLNSFK